MTARPRPAASSPVVLALVPEIKSISQRYSTASQQTQQITRSDSWHDSQQSTFAVRSPFPQTSLHEEINHLQLRHGEQCG
eukprot:5663945-Amphidinium_carterae.1